MFVRQTAAVLDQRPRHDGSLRLLLGYAPGVGKTRALLEEGRRLRGRGVDVVVGCAEAHGRPEVLDRLEGLEVVAARGDASGEASLDGTPPGTRGGMDVAGVLARRPQVVLVDDLGRHNTPGARNPRRWQDVEELLRAGVDVVACLDIDQVESLRDVAGAITGAPRDDTVPDQLLRRAGEIELVDVAPGRLRERLAAGEIYGPDRLTPALASLFRPESLAALRELALRWVADVSEQRSRDLRGEHDDLPVTARERVLVAMPGTGADALIRRGARVAAAARAELLGVHVHSPRAPAGHVAPRLEEERELIVRLGGQVLEVVGQDVTQALLQVARTERASQLVVGAPAASRWRLLRRPVAQRLTESASGVDVHVVSDPGSGDAEVVLAPTRPPALSLRRRITGFLLAGLGLPMLTWVLADFRGHVGLSSALLLYLLLTAAVASIGGALPGLVAAVVGLMLANWFFAPPLHTWSINDAEPEHVIALVVFVVVAGLVSGLAGLAARRSADAARARAESTALARLAATLLESEDPLPRLVHDLRVTFDLSAAAILRRRDDTWTVEAAAGDPVPSSPEQGTDAVELLGDTMLVLVGPRTPADDRRVLAACAAQLAVAVTTQQLQAEAARATSLVETDRLRTALLAAVSHDLRTPLASIKASATSLLQSDVEWTADASRDFLEAIVGDVDHLNALVGNLLDMSRIQTGAVQVRCRPVGLEEVVPAALLGLGSEGRRVDVDLPETLPRVEADPALLERVVANLVSNALKWSPEDRAVRLQAGTSGGRVDLRVVDRGPGIATEDRQRVFQPFQRLGDGRKVAGVGLGLAVSKGFTEAMNGRLRIEDTPGGGTTMVVSLAVAA